MKYIVEAAGLSLREFLFRLVKRLELARHWFLGHGRQHNPTTLACHFKLVAVTDIDLLPDIIRKRDGQLAAAHRRLGHYVLLVLLDRYGPPEGLTRRARLVRDAPAT